MLDLLKVLGAGLSLWEHKEKHKYQDEFIRLKKAIYEEYNKPDSDRDDAVLDRLDFRLRLLASSWASSIGVPDSPVKP